jgi:putative transposase
VRIPRSLILGPGCAFHLWWRGHNREHVLRGDSEKQRYLDLLRRALEKIVERAGSSTAPVELYSFCLMSNHAHISGMVSSSSPSIFPLSRMFQAAHSLFGRWYNRRNHRSGKVAEERFKTRLVENDAALQAVMLYNDANPVKAGMVKHPKDYRWNSYAFYAFGHKVAGSDLLTIPGWYLELGKSASERQRRYRRLVDQYLRREDLLRDRPDDTPDGYFVGSVGFMRARAQQLREGLRKLRLRSRIPP